MDDIVVQVGVLPYRGEMDMEREMAPGLCRGGSIRGAVLGAFFSKRCFRVSWANLGLDLERGQQLKSSGSASTGCFGRWLGPEPWGGSAEDCDSDESTSQEAMRP
jgi:hypothetical protein